MYLIYLEGMGFFRGFDLDGKVEWSKKKWEAKEVQSPRKVCFSIKETLKSHNLVFDILKVERFNPQ